MPRRAKRTVFGVCVFFFISVLFSMDLVAGEILSRIEILQNGAVHHVFTNTNVNVDAYDNTFTFTGMSAAERAQAEEIERANKAAHRRETEHNRRVRAEIEQARISERQLKIYESLQKVDRLAKKYRINTLNESANIGTIQQSRSAIDVTTGQFMPGVAGGVIDPRSGTFYHDVGGGYVNTRTGSFSPKIGP